MAVKEVAKALVSASLKMLPKSRGDTLPELSMPTYGLRLSFLTTISQKVMAYMPTREKKQNSMTALLLTSGAAHLTTTLSPKS